MRAHALLAVALWSSAAHAAGTEQHRALMVAGQLMRTDGKLLRARDLLAECQSQVCDVAADAECEPIRAFCGQRLDELAREIPSVRVRVVDDRGLPLPRASARIGSTVIGHDESLLVDPGRHVLRAEYLGRSAALDFDAQRSEGERTLSIAIDLRQLVVTRPVPWGVWALGIGAGAAATSFGVLAGVSEVRADGYDACRPTCDGSERASFEATTIAADVALGVAVVAAVGAAVLYLARPRAERVVHLGDAR